MWQCHANLPCHTRSHGVNRCTTSIPKWQLVARGVTKLRAFTRQGSLVRVQYRPPEKPQVTWPGVLSFLGLGVDRCGYLWQSEGMTIVECGERQLVAVPPKFFHDHRARGCIAHEDDTQHRQVGRYVEAWLCPCDVADLMCDAEYYATSAGELSRDEIGLMSSARATVKALMSQGVPRMHPEYGVVK